METGVGSDPDLTLLDSLVDLVPGNLEFQQILADIDENLKTNAVGVEQCLQELQSDIHELCPSELVQDTTDCLLWLNNYSFSSLKPSSTPHGQLLEFLRTLLSLLKNQQTEEETILDFLQELSNKCGVSFPCTPSGTTFHFTSRSSLHAVDDDSSMDVKSVWDNVRLHLRRFLVDKLQSQRGVSDAQVRAQCLKHLSFLYPESEVLTKYQSVQKTFATDLLSAYALTTLEESHFEKVVHGYQRSFSVLYTVIKADMTLLSGMIEPPLVVKFINDTFLEILTEEITALLGRVGQLHFNENTLHASKGIKNKHKGAVHAMATQDNSKKGRNVCLSFQQLNCLCQLVKLLLWLEERVKELSMETLCIPCYSDSEKHFRGRERKAQGNSNKGGGESLAKETKANESNPLPERLLQVTEPAVLSFGWRSALKGLSDAVTHCLASEIVDCCSKILQNEQQEQSSALRSVVVLVSLQQRGECREEWPKQVLKFCYDIMEELNTLLPLALACQGESLQEIRAMFVEISSKVVTAVLARLEKRSKQFPTEAPVQNLYAVLSSALYIHQQFTFYDRVMKDTTRKPLFPVPAQRYQDFISELQFQVTNYCVTACATSVMQDAESHNWDDKKAFYEGERCSFSIQMWHYFIGGLQHDLWTILPPRRAQETLAEVLEESLALLASRYVQACPTYKREPQIRIDVASILLSVEHFLWSLCSSVRELCNPTAEMFSRICKIHGHCNNLLIALCVTGAPLNILHEEFQNGLGDTHTTGHIAGWRQWLYSMEPSLSVLMLKTPSVGEMTLLGHLKLLLSQPHCNRNLLLGALLSHDCLLASILLSSTSLNPSKYEDQVKTVEQCPSKESTLVEAVFSVLSYCTLSPRSLTVALERFMEEEQLWDWLSNWSANTSTDSEPEVIGCLRRMLVNSVTGLVKQITSMIYLWNGSENLGKYQHTQRVPESLLKTLPKEWNYIPKEMDRTRPAESVTELVARAVSIVITKLPSVIACLLPSVKYYFFLSERKMSDHFSKSKEAGLLVWSLLTVTSQILEDGSATEQLTGTTLDRDSLEKLGMVSTCLKGILEMHECSPKQVAQKVMQTIEKQKPTWLQSQMRKARRLSIEGFHTHTTHEDATAVEAGSSALGLTEQKINTMVLDICHKPGGGEYLQQIYHIIRLNEEYLNELLSSKSSPFVNIPTNWPLTLNTKIFEEQALIFNPFQAFSLPMATLLHEPSAKEWDCDWSDLLPRCRALNGATFRAMLAHRISQNPESSSEDIR